MWAPLDVACRSSLLLRSARTLSTTLLGFEFLQRPQHVLSNLLDRPHASVWAGSSTIAFSSAFPLALSLAFFYSCQHSPGSMWFACGPTRGCRGLVMTTSGSLRITVANPPTQRYAQQGYATPLWPFSGACTVYLPSKARQD